MEMKDQEPVPEITTDGDSNAVSRRAVLKKAGWVVPALTVLPLSRVFGADYTHISPGTTATYPSQSSTPGAGSSSRGGFFSFLRFLLFWR